MQELTRQLSARRSLHKALSIACLISWAGCVSPQQPKSFEETQPSEHTIKSYPHKSEQQPCINPHPELRAGQAININEAGLFVTSFEKTCRRKKVEADSNYSVMGLPCSAGGGTFDFRGERKKASLVRFHMDVGCPMKNSDASAVASAVRSRIGLSPEAKPVAIHAMSVQVWEIPELRDLGVGEYVALRTMPGLQFFRGMNEQTPLRVRLYGKENSWVPSDKWYQMDADIYLSGYTTFRTELVSAQIMDRSSLKQLKQKCSRSRSPASCDAVLSAGQ